MGFKTLFRKQLANVSGYTGFLDRNFNISELKARPSLAVNLMLSFRDNML